MRSATWCTVVTVPWEVIEQSDKWLLCCTNSHVIGIGGAWFSCQLLRCRVLVGYVVDVC